MGLALCDFKKHKGARTSKTSSTGTLQVALPKPLLEHARHGLVAAQSANLARELAATPPNVANPEYLARYCRRLAKESSLNCTVIDHKKAAQLGMGGLVAVGQAGSTPSRLIILEHKPRGTASQAPVMLVGKAITFDTGGYSLKPVTGITSMKYDKCGGTAVIAAMHAIAQLKLPLHVVALIPAAENMIDSVAYRPDDILTMVNGVTVEIVSTDAEGRLVLADALAYGCKKFKPRAVIDLATLTGGVVVALGKLRAGAFCNDDKLMRRLREAGEETGERLWPLPMPGEYQRLLHSEHADMKNSAGREAHAIQGAVFLSHFVARNGDFKENAHVPWAHLDIAGVADVEGRQDHYGLFPKGPTGFGVRLLVKALEDFTP
jgi:leucyl aminopeptidase